MNETRPDQDAELSRNYNMGSLLAYILPSAFTFVFIAVYQIVDGFFIQKFVGPYAISAVNLYYPIISLLLAVGTMLGTGGNAMIVTLLGRGEREEADRIFSGTLCVSILVSVTFAVIGVIFAEPIMKLLGASEVTRPYLRFYYIVLTLAAPSIMLQTVLGILIIGEGKTVTTGVLIVVGGVINIVFDYIFMKYLDWGTKGAAIATVMGYVIPILYALVFYSPKGGSKYHFRVTGIPLRKLSALCANGSSEMVSNLAAGVTALFMNHMAFRFYGDVGVSVVSVFLYVQFIVMAVFMGMTTAVEPLFSYHLGTGNTGMRKKIYQLSVRWIAVFSVVITALLTVFNAPVVSVFFKDGGDTKAFYDLARKCLYYSVPACLFVGYSIFVSGVFTAFSNGAVSALLSGMRTFVFLTACIFGLSAAFKGDGLWVAWPAAELMSFVFSIAVVLYYRKRKGY